MHNNTLHPGVCSWSLRAGSPAELLVSIRACGVRSVQLHLDPLRTGEWRCDTTAGLLNAARIRIASGMMSMSGEDYSTLESIKKTGGLRPDATWEANLRSAEGNSVLAMRLGLSLVTFHAGFMPHDPADPERATLIDRLATFAEVFASRRVRVALETGQEAAPTLLEVLNEVNAKLPPNAHVGVNFDPANMILYGMGDPVESVRILGPHILQVHIKDANPSDSLGEWGAEMPVGRGSVAWPAFFAALRAVNFRGEFMIEREAGDSRIADITAAREFLAALPA
ncbi:MAG: sugar phosphate isomerase/epimerase [Planctomycetes bacterium]|nr:sugar phosphate isomerase/epimerase [Planctomycetota bacterium]